MRKRILFYSISIILISVLVTAFVSVFFSIAAYLNEKEDSLYAYSRLISQSVSDDFADGTEHSMYAYAAAFSEES
ncbi:MAG: hypothetical protein LBO81_02250, partial [Clostridiales Family XIII bacterium]|nr:hypothetical protein [Clostridiales Family XIII bacterium]